MTDTLPPEAVEALAYLSDHVSGWKAQDALTEIERALQQQAAALERAQQEIERLEAIDTCMCGSPMNEHDIGSGHSPVSMYEYALDAEREAKEAAIAQRDRLAGELRNVITLGDAASVEIPLTWGEGKPGVWAVWQFPRFILQSIKDALAAIDKENSDE